MGRVARVSRGVAPSWHVWWIEVTAFGKQQRGRLQAVSGSNSSLEYHT